MGRPIKFRAWDIINKKWFTPIYEAFAGRLEDIHVGMNGTLGLRTMNQFFAVGPQFILMQYTGLKDKNGKEIYEGDILIVHDVQIVYNATAPYRRVDFKKGNDYKTVCSFEPGMWLVNGEVSGHLVTVVSNANRRKDCGVEVIGNIYEHGHLLNGK